MPQSVAHRAPCPVDEEQEITWPNSYALGEYLATQVDLLKANPSDGLALARRSLANTLMSNAGSATARVCWRAYLSNEDLRLITRVHIWAFRAAWSAVNFAAKHCTNHPETELEISNDFDLGPFRAFAARFEAPAPDNWDGRLTHTIGCTIVALLEAHGSTTRNSAFRTVVEAVDELGTTNGLHLQAQARRILDCLLAELFPEAYAPH
jgi:hypothetical protein